MIYDATHSTLKAFTGALFETNQSFSKDDVWSQESHGHTERVPAAVQPDKVQKP
jgi:hypothetical protein